MKLIGYTLISLLLLGTATSAQASSPQSAKSDTLLAANPVRCTGPCVKWNYRYRNKCKYYYKTFNRSFYRCRYYQGRRHCKVYTRPVTQKVPRCYRQRYRAYCIKRSCSRISISSGTVY